VSDYVSDLNVVDEGLDLVIERFKNKPIFTAFLRIVLARMQHITDTVWNLYAGSWLDNAFGLQLDNLGDIVGETRQGRDDTVYRPWIRARILANRSSGKQQELLKILRVIIGDAPGVTYTPDPPANFEIAISGMSHAGDLARTLRVILNEARAAGVGMRLRYTDDEATAFKFAPDATPDTIDTVHGFGDSTTPTTGGHFAGVV
jgi:hypothetical protein